MPLVTLLSATNRSNFVKSLQSILQPFIAKLSHCTLLGFIHKIMMLNVLFFNNVCVIKYHLTDTKHYMTWGRLKW